VVEWLAHVLMGGALLCVLPPLFALLLLGVYLLILEARWKSRTHKQAEHDYRIARGTQHLHQLRACLPVLHTSLKNRQAKVGKLEKQLNSLNQKRSTELQTALSTHLVNQRLTEVPGIGQTLSRDIIRHCFRGNLHDLRFASRIRGVGPSRHRAIMAWVYARERELPRLLDGSFPDKQRILSKYAKQEQVLKAALESERTALDRENELFEKADVAASKLRKIKPSHFRKALRSNSPKPPVPAWYFVGVYPPWEPMPEWFETLLSEYRS
jgi:hypothetical protein